MSDIPLYPSFLELRTLAELSLYYYRVHTPLDVISDLLETNHSLESVRIDIASNKFTAKISPSRVVVLNQLQHL